MDVENLYQRMTASLWPNTKIRMQRWKAAVSAIQPNLKRNLFKRDNAKDPEWSRFMSLTHEIILTESLTRVHGAVVMSQTDCSDVRDIVADIVSDNIQIRKRVLVTIESAPSILKAGLDQMLELQVLNEHINDMMLSQLPNRVVSRAFAMKANAFDEFVKCAGDYREDVIRQANMALGLAFSSGVQNLAHPLGDNEDINQKIVNDMANLFEASVAATVPGAVATELVC